MLCSQRGPLLRALGFAAFRAKRGKKEGLLTADCTDLRRFFIEHSALSLLSTDSTDYSEKLCVSARGLLTADSQIYADFLSNTQRSLFCPPIPPITLKNSVALRGDFIEHSALSLLPTDSTDYSDLEPLDKGRL